MNRLLLIFSISFISGAVASLLLNIAPLLVITLFVAIFGTVIFIKNRKLFVLMTALGFVLGSAYSLCYKIVNKPTLDEYLNKDTFSCKGIVTKIEGEHDFGTYVHVKLYNKPEKILLLITGEKAVYVNNEVRLNNVKITLANESENTGSFNYRRYLKSIGINYVGNVSSENVAVYNENGGKFPFKQARKINEWLTKRIIYVFGKNDIGGFIAGITIGNKIYFSDSLKILLSNAGISHIAAISGFHIAILATFLFMFLENFSIDVRIKRGLVVLLLITFALVTGMSGSVIRAGLMVSMGLLAVSVNHDYDLFTIIGFAGLIIIISNPYMIFNTGCQMSFSATVGITTIGTKLMKKLPDLSMGRIKDSFIVSASAQIGVLPVMIASYGSLSLISVLINVIIIPVIPIIYLLVFFSLILNINPFVYVTERLIEFVFAVAGISQKIKFNIVYLPSSARIIIGVFLMVCFIVYGTFRKRNNKVFAAGLIISLAIILVSVYNVVAPPDNFEITFLNVGHGDCTLVRGRDGKVMLVDTGELTECEDEVVPYLRRCGIRKIDLLVLSHFHSDHAGGFLSIANSFDVEKVLVPGVSGGEDVYSLCRQKDIEISEAGQGKTLNFSNSKLDILYAPSNESNDENETSIVMKISVDNREILLCGDATLEILNNTDNINADIFKVAHHGSKTSSSEELLRKINPKICIVSSEDGGRYNLPDEEVKEILNKYKTFYTYEEKTIKIKINERGEMLLGGKRIGNKNFKC